MKYELTDETMELGDPFDRVMPLDRDELTVEDDCMNILSEVEEQHFIEESCLTQQDKLEYGILFKNPECKNLCWYCGKDLIAHNGVVVILNNSHKTSVNVIFYCKDCYEHRCQAIKDATIADFMI